MGHANNENIVRWGILGTAAIADKVHKAIERSSNSSTVAIASRSPDKAKDWARQRSVPQTFDSYNALLDSPDVDAVYIPLPASMHYEWTIKAAEKGKHILCEKPLSIDPRQSEEMISACQHHGVHLMDGVMWVHHLRTPMMLKHIQDGDLGQLRRMNASFSFCWDEIPKDNIRLDRSLGGGCLGDLGYYCVRAIWLVFQEKPKKVYANARYYNDVEMNFSALLWFDDDRMAAFDCAFDTVMRQWFEVAGTKASLICDDFVLPWKESKSRYWIHDAEGQSTEHAAFECCQEVQMIHNFSEQVKKGVHDPYWSNEALVNMQICDALARSARQEEIIHL